MTFAISDLSEGEKQPRLKYHTYVWYLRIMSALSPKQLEILKFIQRFLDSSGLPPTRGEIAVGMGLRNRQGIDQHLRALQAKGVIDLIPGISRGIRVTDEAFAQSTRNSSKKMPPEDMAGLPLLGRIAAGSPILALGNIEDHLQVDPALFRPRADFLLRVRGDSMKDADILDRDLLAVHQTSQARTGQIVVARLGDEATVKRYRREGTIVRLEPANSGYEPIEIDLRRQEFAIEGLAVGIIRTGHLRAE
jgi:repressor LexA